MLSPAPYLHKLPADFTLASRLSSLVQDLGGATSDLSLAFTHNPASQIATNTRSNDAYAWTGHGSGSTAATANGLNQLTNVGGTTIGHDAKGNITSTGTQTFGYTAENRLATAPGTDQYHDPVGRLAHLSGSVTDLLYDGANVIQEVGAGGGATRRRFVHGPGVDEPLVWYEGSGTGDKRYLHADERGSVVAVSDGSGNLLGINKYDEYGVPASTNIGRFQYTGQVWLPEITAYNYKARIYAPKLGRFLQTDPIGYGDGMNMYGYVGGDPVNGRDPSGRNGCGLSNDEEPSVCGRLPSVRSIVIYISGKIKKGLINVVPGRKGGGGAAGRKADKPKNVQCYGPPEAPGTGASKRELTDQARSNAAEAESRYGNPRHLFWFRSQVRNDGPWDYKQYHEGFQDFGNYNYGRTGAAMGLATDFLLGRAGLAQQDAGTSKPEWGDPGFLGFSDLGGTGSNGDHPRDQEMIRRGISDQRNGC